MFLVARLMLLGVCVIADCCLSCLLLTVFAIACVIVLGMDLFVLLGGVLVLPVWFVGLVYAYLFVCC